MAAQIGDVAVRVGADITDLKRGMSEGGKSVESFSSKASRHFVVTAGDLANLAGAAIRTAKSFTVDLYKAGANTVDSQAKIARSVGGTVASIQALDRVSQLAGISQGALSDAAAKLNARLGEAMRGTGAAVVHLEKLKLTADDLAGMDTDERLAAIADRMVEMGYNTAQAGDLMRQFGVRQKEIVGLMLEGGDAFRNARKEVNEFGVAVTDVDAAKIEAANDAMTAMKFTTQAVANTVAVKLSPYIQEIGSRFGDASKESGGFKDEVTATINTALKGFGKFGDVIQGVRVVFKGLELVTTGFGAAVVSTIELAWTVTSKFLDGVIEDVNKVITTLNKLPKVDIATIDPFSQSSFMQGLHQMGEDARNRVSTVRTELHNLAMQELPSSQIEKFLADVAVKSQEAADAAVNARNRIGGDGEEEGTGGLDEKARADLEKKLEAIRAANLTEQELLREKQLTDREILAEGLANQLIDEQTYLDQSAELRKRYQDEHTALEEKAAAERAKIVEMEMQARKAAIGDALSNLSTLMNSENKKMFKIGKMAAQSQTLISTYEGAQKAYSALAGIPFVGPVLGAAAAGAAILAGKQRLDAIRSTSFGGASTPSAGSNTTAINDATTPVAQGGGQQERIMRIEGFNSSSLYQGSQLQSMAGALEEFWGDGGGKGRVIFA